MSTSTEKSNNKSTKPDLPSGVSGWCWGAFLLTWIWGVGNRTYRSFWVFVPIVNLFVWFALGLKGREWAWRHKKWDSVEHFNRVQRKWSIAGFIIVLLAFILSFAIEHPHTLFQSQSHEGRFMSTCNNYRNAIETIKDQANAIQKNDKGQVFKGISDSLKLNQDYIATVQTPYAAWQNACLLKTPTKNENIPTCAILFSSAKASTKACIAATKLIYDKQQKTH